MYSEKNKDMQKKSPEPWEQHSVMQHAHNENKIVEQQ